MNHTLTGMHTLSPTTHASPAEARLRRLVAGLLGLTLAACSSADEVTDDLAGEAEEEVGDDKADITTPGGASQYFAIRPDTRRCLPPFCGGYYLDRLNSTLTRCHDGEQHEECYTPDLDWSQIGLTTMPQLTLSEAMHRFGGGVHAIVRGKFAARNVPSAPNPELGRFIVTEAWVAVGTGVSDGVFAKVIDNGLRCIVAPCPTLTESALNSSRRANITDIDFTAGTFTDDEVIAMHGDTFTVAGLIVAGDRYTYRVGGRRGTGRTATQAYRNVANLPATE